MRQEKQLLLDEVKEKIEGSKGFIITSYKALTAEKNRNFRDVVAPLGEFEVVKKRVFAKAAEAMGYKFNVKQFQGHVGVLFAKHDTTALSKATLDYSDSNDKAFEILGGVIDGALCSGEDVVAVAKLPALPELRAQFLALLASPMQETIGTLQSALTSVLYCMDEKSKKEESI